MDIDDKLAAVLDALADYQEAKGVEDKERAEYQGYEWGYFGYNVTERTKNEKTRFGIALDEFLDAKIDDRLRNINLTPSL